jgi:hypothetical protein
MSHTYQQNGAAIPHNRAADFPDPIYRSLYRVGGLSSILIAALLIFAIIAYFIWPFKPGTASTADILMALHTDRLGGLMSLDLTFPFLVTFSILPLLAVYAALKQVDRSFALIALVMGLAAALLLLPSRPLAELVLLSDKYAAATSGNERLQYLAAAEGFLALFNGTAWMIYTILNGISTLIFSVLMLRGGIFGKLIAAIGIVSAIGSQGVFVPMIGPLLSLFATFGGVLWSILIARKFLQYAYSS